MSQSKITEHRFEPGNKHGRGRPEGSRNRATIAIQTLLDGEGEAIARQAVEMARAGDTTAIRTHEVYAFTCCGYSSEVELPANAEPTYPHCSVRLEIEWRDESQATQPSIDSEIADDAPLDNEVQKPPGCARAVSVRVGSDREEAAYLRV